MEKKVAAAVVAATMEGARAEKEEAVSIDAARPAPAWMDKKSATDKTARMEDATRSQAHGDDVAGGLHEAEWLYQHIDLCLRRWDGYHRQHRR